MRNAIVHNLHKQARDRKFFLKKNYYAFSYLLFVGGETISLKDLTAAADEVAHLGRSKEEVARLKGQLQEKRELAHVGLHANNFSAGADSRAIVNRIQDEVRKYLKRFPNSGQFITA
jgi:hypothetical protein